MINSLKKVAKDFNLFDTLKESDGGTNVNAQSDLATDEANLINKLDKSVKFDEVDTVTFGLETDDDKIVKVYVNAEQAEAFEKALAVKLGEVDDIEEVLNDLSKEFEIVDVEWPDEQQEDDNKDDTQDDGSSALDQRVYGPDRGKSTVEDSYADSQYESLNYGEGVTLELLESTASIESRFTTASQLMVYHAILDLGIPEIALARNPYRAAIIKGIKEAADSVQKNSSMKNAIKQFIRGAIDFEKKAKENESEHKKSGDIEESFKKEPKEPNKEIIKLSEEKIDWSFGIKKDDLLISCQGISMTLDPEESEKLIKGINNHNITVVRDNSETPAKKFVFSPRGKNMLVKTVGSAEGYLMTAKDIEELLNTLTSEVTEDVENDFDKLSSTERKRLLKRKFPELSDSILNGYAREKWTDLPNDVKREVVSKA